MYSLVKRYNGLLDLDLDSSINYFTKSKDWLPTDLEI